MKEYNPLYGIRINNQDFSFNHNTKIKSIPLYSVFCLRINNVHFKCTFFIYKYYFML